MKRIKIKFVKEDCWIGIYWKKRYNIGYEARNGVSELVVFKIYICLIPCFPIIIRIV